MLIDVPFIPFRGRNRVLGLVGRIEALEQDCGVARLFDLHIIGLGFQDGVVNVESAIKVAGVQEAFCFLETRILFFLLWLFRCLIALQALQLWSNILHQGIDPLL